MDDLGKFLCYGNGPLCHDDDDNGSGDVITHGLCYIEINSDNSQMNNISFNFFFLSVQVTRNPC